ncbi:MAG: FAD-dependent oxidoreductase [Coriobacteriia bacterium]
MSESGQVSRRDFIKVGAGGAAGLVVGAGVTALAMPKASGATEPNLPEKWDYETDVVVVGSGAGLLAANVAADAGASVILLESAATLGGCTTINEGWITAGGGTKVQKEAGVTDTPEDFYAEWLRNIGGLADNADIEVMKTIVINTAKGIDHLVDMGVTLKLDIEPFYQRIARTHLVQPNAGGWVTALKAYADKKGVKIMIETPATSLITKVDGTVVGVKAKSGDTVLNIKAGRGVILAAGDYAGNAERIKRFFPPSNADVPSMVPTNDGSGVFMAQAVGADLSGGSYFDAIQIVYDKAWGLEGYFVDRGVIHVNKNGKRYVAEDSAQVPHKSLEQPDRTVFSIFSKEIADIAHRPADQAAKVAEFAAGKTLNPSLISGIGQAYLEDLIDKGALVQGDTLDDLASKLGIDAANLKSTVDTWNASVASGTDTEFGRNMKKVTAGFDDHFGPARPIAAAPYYGMKASTWPAARANAMGPGLVIDTTMRVLNPYGKPIPRLYAVGQGMLCSLRYPFVQHGFSMGLNVATASLAAAAVAAEEPWA